MLKQSPVQVVIEEKDECKNKEMLAYFFQPFEDCLIWKTLRLGWCCLSSLIICIGVLNFGSIPVAISGVLFLYDVGGVAGWLAGGREGDPEAFLFLLAGV